MARQARQAWRGKARPIAAARGVAGSGEAGKARLGVSQLGNARLGMAGQAWHGSHQEEGEHE